MLLSLPVSARTRTTWSFGGNMAMMARDLHLVSECTNCRTERNFRANRWGYQIGSTSTRFSTTRVHSMGLALSILNFNFEEYRKICESGEGDNASAIEVVYGSLSTAFDFFIPFLKHPCYANERENRLVLHGHSVPRSKIQFRARRGYFKPYLDFTIAAESGGLPLDTVVLGPSTNSRRCEESVRMFLDRHELGDGQVAIERSLHPLPRWRQGRHLASFVLLDLIALITGWAPSARDRWPRATSVGRPAAPGGR